MKEFIRIGCSVVGTEIAPQLIDLARAEGRDVRRGFAEDLPFENSSFDRVLCSVVVPYTDERKTVSEWARVIKPGGRIYASYHGIGYPLYQIAWTKGHRIHGMRTLLNACCYWVTGRRLPGLLGDSLCQSSRRLGRYYNDLGLELDRELVVAPFVSYPRFLCHQLRKPI
jgi:SAM-dependent methyltransferase